MHFLLRGSPCQAIPFISECHLLPHDAKNVSHNGGKASHCASHSARRLSHGAGKMSYYAGKVLLDAGKVFHVAREGVSWCQVVLISRLIFLNS